jgi:hypothetical protein
MDIHRIVSSMIVLTTIHSWAAGKHAFRARLLGAFLASEARKRVITIPVEEIYYMHCVLLSFRASTMELTMAVICNNFEVAWLRASTDKMKLTAQGLLTEVLG